LVRSERITTEASGLLKKMMDTQRFKSIFNSISETIASTIHRDEEEDDDILIERESYSIMCRVCNTKIHGKQKKTHCDNCGGYFCEKCITENATVARISHPIKSCKACIRGETPGQMIRGAVKRELTEHPHGRKGQGEKTSKRKAFKIGAVLKIPKILQSNNFLLIIKRIEALDLKNVEMLAGDENDPYCKLRLVCNRDWSAQTDVQRDGGSNVSWDLLESETQWRIPITREEMKQELLHITMMDENKFTSHIKIGEGHLALAPLLDRGIRAGDQILEVMLTDVKGATGRVVITVELTRLKESSGTGTGTGTGTVEAESRNSFSSVGSLTDFSCTQPRPLHLLRGGYYGTGNQRLSDIQMPSSGYFELVNKSDEMCAIKILAPVSDEAHMDINTAIYEAIFPIYLAVPPEESVHFFLGDGATSVTLCVLFNNPHLIPSSATSIIYDTRNIPPRKAISLCASIRHFKQFSVYHIDCHKKNILLKYKREGVVQVRNGATITKRMGNAFTNSIFASFGDDPENNKSDENAFAANIDKVDLIFRSSVVETETDIERCRSSESEVDSSAVSASAIPGYHTVDDKDTTARRSSISVSNNSSGGTSAAGSGDVVDSVTASREKLRSVRDAASYAALQFPGSPGSDIILNPLQTIAEEDSGKHSDQDRQNREHTTELVDGKSCCCCRIF